MSGEINVLSRIQTIIVEPTSGAVSIINAGPQGPPGGGGGGTGGDGILIVADVTSIPYGDRTVGLVAYQTNFSAVGNPGLYVLADGIDDTDWQYDVMFKDMAYYAEPPRAELKIDWQIDDVTGASFLYIGKAPFGFGPNIAAWIIKRILFNGRGGIAQIAWSDINAIWDNRTNEEYITV